MEKRKENNIVSKNDTLKYWRIVRKWAIESNEDLTLSILELILFFYTEKPFNQQKFNEYCAILSWDKPRLKTLVRQEWLSIFREGSGRAGNAKLYIISTRSKILCKTIYKKLYQEEKISESARVSPMFKANPSYSDKVYKTAIKRMNQRFQEHQDSQKEWI